jgi:D-beta-D-heptose 7-phosphate kinase/D-beta-D-heptose 1-phosphate adenosyltransferase
VYDVSGAGDTVIAIMAAGIAGDLELDDIMNMANIAAGVVVARVGVYPINSIELREAVRLAQGVEQSAKVCRLDELISRVEQWRKNGDRIVFTNGCFDLLHAGHVTYLEHAGRCGDRLIVGLNTDRSVREIKGPKRPVIREQDRGRVLAALESVDAVVLFDEPTPMGLIQSLSPDVLAKGADYTEDQVVGGSYVKEHGGEVVLIPLLQGKSSSAIIDDLQ